MNAVARGTGIWPEQDGAYSIRYYAAVADARAAAAQALAFSGLQPDVSPDPDAGYRVVVLDCGAAAAGCGSHFCIPIRRHYRYGNPVRTCHAYHRATQEESRGEKMP